MHPASRHALWICVHRQSKHNRASIITAKTLTSSGRHIIVYPHGILRCCCKWRIVYSDLIMHLLIWVEFSLSFEVLFCFFYTVRRPLIILANRQKVKWILVVKFGALFVFFIDGKESIGVMICQWILSFIRYAANSQPSRIAEGWLFYRHWLIWRLLSSHTLNAFILLITWINRTPIKTYMLMIFQPVTRLISWTVWALLLILSLIVEILGAVPAPSF